MSLASNQSAAAKTDAVLDDLLEEFVQRIERGENPSVEDFIHRNPDRACELRQLLPAARIMASLGVGGDVDAKLSTSTRAVPPELRDLGDFRLQRELGRGGMGIVYEAEQISLGRRVALKVLPFATVLDPRQLQRFKNEARAAATLDHPHIVHVYSVGQERGVHFYAMQLIEGQSLAEVWNERRAGDLSTQSVPPASARDVREVTPPAGLYDDTAPHAKQTTAHAPHTRDDICQIARWGIQAAEALEYAHQLGIVHRDIKPSNLLVNAEGKLWVADFGLAMTQGDNGLTMTGDILGTLRYMSPEQALGQRGVVDQRSDVYSLGITLYELLALRPAFEHANRAEVLRSIELHDPPPLRRHGSPIPAELETIVFKAINKDPVQRYSTAQELADDLQRFLNDQPIRARRPTLRGTVAKWSRRNKGPLAAALVVLIVLLAGIVGTSWGLVRSERARLAEVHHRELAEASERKALAAAAAEKQAKEQAQAREAETEAMLGFIQNKILAAARPKGQDGGLGVNVTLQEALRSALPSLSRELADQPFTEARLRKTMGISFWELGDYTDAALQLERAVALYTQHLGDRHPETLDTLSWLALSYNSLGRQSDVAQMCEKGLALAQSALGLHARPTGSMRHHLADAYRGLGRPAEALPLIEENLEMSRIKHGPESFQFKETLGFLGLCYKGLGRHAEAIEVLEQSLVGRRDRHGPNHFITLDCMIWLSDCYSAVGREESAIPLLEEVMTTTKTMYGTHYLRTKKSMERLADSYARAGRRNDAMTLREEALALPWNKNSPEARPVWESIMRKLIVDYAADGRHAEALKRHEELLEFHESGPDADDRATAGARNGFAWYLATSPDPSLRDPKRAVSLATQAVEVDTKKGDYWNALGAAQYRIGDWTASLESLEKAMALRDGGNSFDWFFVAMSHWQLGDETRAREMYHTAVEWMEQNKPHDAELIRLRAECEELLSIVTKPTSEPVSR